MRVVSDEKVLTIYIEDKFTFNSHPEFRKAYETLGNRKPVVNFNRATYLDSAALGMLLMLRDKSTQPVELKDARGKVLDVLRIANFQKLFVFV